MKLSYIYYSMKLLWVFLLPIILVIGFLAPLDNANGQGVNEKYPGNSSSYLDTSCLPYYNIELCNNVIPESPNFQKYNSPLYAQLSGPTWRGVATEEKKKVPVSVKETRFGAKGDGVADDTAAIQRAIDWLYVRGGGVLLFPRGIYLVTSVNIKEGITYQGNGATIKRPDNLTAKIGQKAAKWVRTFTNQKNPYAGQNDSRPLIIRGLTFDGSSQSQGPYQHSELEQAALVFLMGDKNHPGRLTAVIEDCVFKDGVGDGVHAFVNTNLKMDNCRAENVFRGGFVLTGGHSIAVVKNLTTKGKIDNTGIDVEVDAPGYGHSKKVEVYLENLKLIDGDFDVGVDSDSLVVGKNIQAEAPFNLYTKHATARFTGCRFGVQSGNRIIHPQDVIFTDCEFFSSNKPTRRPDKLRIAAPFVAWNVSGTWEKNQKLTFNNCTFIAKDRGDGISIPIFGIYTGWDPLVLNNILTLNNCTISVQNGTGLAMQSRGGNWVVRNTVFDTALSLSFTGFLDYKHNTWFKILLDGIVIKQGKYAHIAGYGSSVGGQANQNKLEQRHIIIENEDINYISSLHGLDGNQYTGFRLIKGIAPPSESTHGLVGDIFELKDGSKKWRCTKAGYVLNRSYGVIKVNSKWEPLL